MGSSFWAQCTVASDSDIKQTCPVLLFASQVFFLFREINKNQSFADCLWEIRHSRITRKESVTWSGVKKIWHKKWTMRRRDVCFLCIRLTAKLVLINFCYQNHWELDLQSILSSEFYLSHRLGYFCSCFEETSPGKAVICGPSRQRCRLRNWQIARSPRQRKLPALKYGWMVVACFASSK